MLYSSVRDPLLHYQYEEEIYFFHCVFHLYPKFYIYYLCAIIYFTCICSVTHRSELFLKKRYMNIYYFFFTIF